MKETDYIKTWLKKNLSDERYSHSIGTAETALKLAKKYGVDENKAYLAGLVHDCAKNMDNQKLLDLIKNEIKVGFDDSELKNPKVYHSIVAPYTAKKEFEIEDKEILNAIRVHTIGSINMTLFDKIIFLADKIEPNTREESYYKPICDILETKGIDSALYKCYSGTIKSLVDRKLFICPVTVEIYNKLSEELSQ